MQELTQEYLKIAIYYNPDNGSFIWNTRPIDHFSNKHGMNISNSQRAGNEIKTINGQGYLIVRLNNRIYRLHQLAWLYMTGEMPKHQIDHINGIRTDNRFCNLREATNSENMQNLKKAMISNKSTGLLGASKSTTINRFRARIKINGKEHIIGYFDTPQEAHEAYLIAKRKHHKFNTL